MHKKEIHICIFLMAVVLLVGGGFLFRDISGERREAKRTETKKDEGMVSLAEAFDAERVLGKTYDNLQFPKDLQVRKREALCADTVYAPNLQAQNTKNCACFFKARLKRQGLFDTYSEKNIIFEKNTYPLGESYYDGDDIYEGVGCTGFFTANARSVSTNSEDYKEIFLMQEKHENKKFKLENGEVSVDEAAALAEREMELCLEELGYSCEVKVHKIIVYEDKKHRTVLTVLFQQSYGGIPITDVHDRHPEEGDQYLERAAGWADITGPEKEDIAGITFSEGCLEQYEKKELDKILPFSRAAEELNTYLAKYRGYQVREAALEYRLLRNGNLQEDGKMGNGEKMQHRKEVPWATTCSYDSYRLVPCWTFCMDMTYEKEIVAYVNALTGEVKFICNQ